MRKIKPRIGVDFVAQLSGDTPPKADAPRRQRSSSSPAERRVAGDILAGLIMSRLIVRYFEGLLPMPASALTATTSRSGHAEYRIDIVAVRRAPSPADVESPLIAEKEAALAACRHADCATSREAQ